MPTKHHIWLSIVLCAAGLFAGCATSTAPSRSIPTAAESATDAYGAWACIATLAPRRIIRGELIAVATESLYLITDKLIVIPRESIQEITLTRFEQEHGGLALWSVFGTLSTISHGVFLVGSAPLWIITGIGATSKASREPLVHPHPVERRSISTYELAELAPYARFPQGIPRGLNRIALRPR